MRCDQARSGSIWALVPRARAHALARESYALCVFHAGACGPAGAPLDTWQMHDARKRPASKSQAAATTSPTRCTSPASRCSGGEGPLVDRRPHRRRCSCGDPRRARRPAAGFRRAPIGWFDEGWSHDTLRHHRRTETAWAKPDRHDPSGRLMSIWTARLLNDYDRPEGLRIVREAADMHPQGRVTERDVDKLVRPDEGQQLRESYAPLPAFERRPRRDRRWIERLSWFVARAEPLLGSEWLRGHETAMLGVGARPCARGP